MHKKGKYMKIVELLKKDSPHLSFEVFPPKTETSFDEVKLATEEIAKLRPAYMSVQKRTGKMRLQRLQEKLQ